jgi:ABC-2 type transport system ATP-binding protein
MLQTGGLLGGVTVREMVELMCGLAPDPLPVDEVIATARIGDITDQRADRLSGGQTQRVRFALAIAGNPQLLVLDEPTSGLDPHQVIAVRDLIQSLAGSHTVLIASHILPEIEKIASRVMILLDGRLLTPDALKQKAEGTMLRLAASAPEATVRGVVSGVAGVRSIAVEPAAGSPTVHYLIRTEPHASLATEIVTALVRADVAVSEMSELRPDLERVFLDLTRRSLEVAA